MSRIPKMTLTEAEESIREKLNNIGLNPVFDLESKPDGVYLKVRAIVNEDIMEIENRVKAEGIELVINGHYVWSIAQHFLIAVLKGKDYE